jgi:hypothetical protein
LSLELTEQGQQANRILAWVFDDPDGRAAEGMRRLNALAETATGQALTEIRDAGTTVSRMIPPARTMPSDTISSQLAGQ